MIKVRRKIQFVKRDRGRQVLTNAPLRVAEVQGGRIPRVSRLMALAIHFDWLIRKGTVRDITELARLAHVTQPRMTQIMNLNHLAPDIQEGLLFLPCITKGRELICEKILRPMCAEPDWQQQRKSFQSLRQTGGGILTPPTP